MRLHPQGFRGLHIYPLLTVCVMRQHNHRTGYRTPIRTGRGLTSLWGILGRSSCGRVIQKLLCSSCRACTLLSQYAAYVSHVQHALWCTEANPNLHSPVPSSLLASACVLLVYINSERRCVYTQQDVCWMIAMCIVKELHGERCDDWPHRGFVPYESPVIQFLTGLRPVYQNNATLSSCY